VNKVVQVLMFYARVAA